MCYRTFSEDIHAVERGGPLLLEKVSMKFSIAVLCSVFKSTLFLQKLLYCHRQKRRYELMVRNFMRSFLANSSLRML